MFGHVKTRMNRQACEAHRRTLIICRLGKKRGAFPLKGPRTQTFRKISFFFTFSKKKKKTKILSKIQLTMFQKAWEMQGNRRTEVEVRMSREPYQQITRTLVARFLSVWLCPFQRAHQSFKLLFKVLCRPWEGIYSCRRLWHHLLLMQYRSVLSYRRRCSVWQEQRSSVTSCSPALMQLTRKCSVFCSFAWVCFVCI